MAIRIDGHSSATLVNRYVAKTTFTKFCPETQRPLHTKRGYKVQWQNIKNDIRFVSGNEWALRYAYGVFGFIFFLKTGNPIHLFLQGAVAVDTDTIASNNASATSITVTHTAGGANRVVIGWATRNAGTAGEAMTYDGVDMGTRVVGGSFNWINSTYVMVAPNTTANANCTYSQTAAATSRHIECVTLTGAAQTSPVDGSVAGGNNAGNSDTQTVTTGTANSMLVDFAICYDGNRIATITPLAGQTTILTSTLRAAPDYDDCSSYKLTTTAGAYTMRMDSNRITSWYWDHAVVGIKPFVAAAATNPHLLSLLGVGG